MMPYRLTSGFISDSRGARSGEQLCALIHLNPMGVETNAKAAVKKPAVHPNTWVFFGRDFARYNDVKLGLMTHALHYGTAVFEGIRAYWNVKQSQLFLLEPAAHFERMKRSANVMRMELPYS